MKISTVSRRQRSRVKELCPRIIDVTPGAGDAEFSITLDLWEIFTHHSFSYMDLKEWDTLLEIALWERYLAYPNNWMQNLQSLDIVLVSREPYANSGVYTARAQIALALYRVLKCMGFKPSMGFEYSDPHRNEKEIARYG